MDMTILAHAIFGVFLDCSAAAWQMRLQPQAHKYVSAGAPILHKSKSAILCNAVVCSAAPRLADQKLYSVSQHQCKLLHIMQHNINAVFMGKCIERSSMPAVCKSSLLAPQIGSLCDSTSAIKNGIHIHRRSKGTYKRRGAR